MYMSSKLEWMGTYQAITDEASRVEKRCDGKMRTKLNPSILQLAQGGFS